MNSVTNYYDELDLKYPEIAIAMDDIDRLNPKPTRFIIPILTPNLNNSNISEYTIHQNRSNLQNNDNILEIDNITITNYVTIPVPKEVCGGLDADLYKLISIKQPIENNNTNNDIVKPGMIYINGSNTLPDGFLWCDGSEYSRSEYPELFAAVGTYYGSGDGSTTFNVPDLTGRSAIGADDTCIIGTMGGENIITLIDMNNSNDTSPENTNLFTAVNYIIYAGKTNKNYYDIVKPGMIYINGSNTLPDGFLWCDGSEYSRSEYPELFAAVGTYYGKGNNNTTFNVPDLTGRSAIGADDTCIIGTMGGENIITLIDMNNGFNNSNINTNLFTAVNYIIYAGKTNKNYNDAGMIYINGSNTLPDGFLWCDGSEYSRSEYPELFDIIKTYYGSGDGSTTFNVPDLTGRSAIGADDTCIIGTMGGENIITLIDMNNGFNNSNINTNLFTAVNYIISTGKDIEKSNNKNEIFNTIDILSNMTNDIRYIKKGSKWLVVFVGGDITNPRIIARYE